MWTTSFAGIVLATIVAGAPAQAESLKLDGAEAKALVAPDASNPNDFTESAGKSVVINPPQQTKPEIITAPVPSAASTSLIGLGILGIVYVFHLRRKHRA